MNTNITLWPNKIPNSQKRDDVVSQTEPDYITYVETPTLEVFIPQEQTSKKAIIICPGGGYEGIVINREGRDVAKWLNKQGITAFVLQYRLPHQDNIVTSYEAPLQDAQRAIRTVKAQAVRWNLDKNQIGIMGFSAGGHLAATLGTQFNYVNSFDKDEIDILSAKPAFMILIYPVISMQEGIRHEGSKENLLGENPSNNIISLFSNEKQVKRNTPPTFIVHAADDTLVPVENSQQFYDALQKENIPSELHIYPYGEHGFDLAMEDEHLGGWKEKFLNWLD